MKDKTLGFLGLIAFLFLIGWLQNRDLEAKQWKAGISCHAPEDRFTKLIVVLDRSDGKPICSYHPIKTYGAAP